MPIPLIIAALAAGGSLVPHAAGGFIVSAAGAYVAGTYLSTAAVATIIGTGSATLAVGAAVATGAASSIVGSAGIFGTTVGASGLTGVLMSAGLISATPLYVPVLAAAAGLSAAGFLAYGSYQLYTLKKKIGNALPGEEVKFSAADAKFLQRLLLKIYRSLRGKGDTDSKI